MNELKKGEDDNRFDKKANNVKKTNMKICQHFKQYGWCKYGKTCRHIHIEIKR
jgi:hypothetical protein